MDNHTHNRDLPHVTRDIILHVGVANKSWNGYDIPQSIDYACVSPISGRTEASKKENSVKLPKVPVIQDSGAFSDSWTQRVSYSEAWDRQQAHAEKYNYIDQVTHRASYDLLIDETWTDGQRKKKRWTQADAEQAVIETVNAAKYTASKNTKLGLIQSAQGVTPKQYHNCAMQVIDYIDTKKDILGLGGWCIVGVRRELMPIFEQTIKLVIPTAAKRDIKNIHIWGVIYPPALGLLLWYCDQHKIKLSTDSMSPSLTPIYGEWGYSEWRRKIDHIPPTRKGQSKAIHVCNTKHYLGSLRNTAHYVSHFTTLNGNTCVMCGKQIRDNAKTCSNTCRKRMSRCSVVTCGRSPQYTQLSLGI